MIIWLKSLVIAFSLYSRIPMPQFVWEKEDMRYHLVFFPWVGAVSGGIVFLLLKLFSLCELSLILRIAAVSMIPLIITGGFHLDGFMDVSDALSSYGSREKKLEILKDPHVGAFAVISLLGFSVIWAGALSYLLEKINMRSALVLALCFVLARALSGITAISFKKARVDGMLRRETDGAGRVCVVILLVETALCAAAMIMADLYGALAVLAAAALFIIYYRIKMYKEFGGVSGDTAGYFVSVCELLCIVALAVRSAVCI